MGAILVTVLNSVFLYEWWSAAIYIIFWFVCAFFFTIGKVLNKLLAVIISCIVVISVSNLATSIFSILLKSSLDEIYTQHNI